MSIFESIKEERKLSFNHWRYRILHWAFNVEEPDSKNLGCNGIPTFLYTHYCPLFHLTNLIALLSPIIVFLRIIGLIFCALYACTNLVPWQKIKEYIFSFIPEKVEKEKVKVELTPEMERIICINHVCGWGNNLESFLSYFSYKFLTKEDATNIFNEYMPKIIEARQEAELRKKRWRELIIFWTNFSQIFIKWVINVVYFVLVAFLLGLIYLIAQPVYSLICWLPTFVMWLFEDGVGWVIFWAICKLLFLSTVAFTIIVVLFKSGVAKKFFTVFFKGLKYITPPVFVFSVPFNWIKNGINNTVEFVAMFYEENCPPIKIISKEEAVVESVARNGEEV
jgi:hypothetical protein